MSPGPAIADVATSSRMSLRRVGAGLHADQESPLHLAEEPHRDAQDLQFDRVARGHLLHLEREFRQVAHGGIVDLEDQVARLEARAVGGAAGLRLP